MRQEKRFFEDFAAFYPSDPHCLGCDESREGQIMYFRTTFLSKHKSLIYAAIPPSADILRKRLPEESSIFRRTLIV